DNPRVAARIGRGQARVAMMMLLTLRGTPTMYYGEEIGMQNVPIPPEAVQDPFEKNVPGMGLGRDPQRTPMQWDASPNSGFTKAANPWLPIAADANNLNVAAQREQPKSMLTLYRRLIQLRRSEPALAIGTYEPVKADCELILYRRHEAGKAFLIALNLSGQAAECTPNGSYRGTIRLSTHLDREGEHVQDLIRLRGDEGIVIQLTS